MHFGYWERGIGFFNRDRQIKEMNRQVLKSCKLKEGNHLLDLGCGLGGLLRSAHERDESLRYKVKLN